MKDFLESSIRQFKYYKSLGDKTFSQIPEEKLFWQPDAESNSIAIIVKHMHGNMLSRWTDFMTTDGEKEWRKRDEEFEADIRTKAELLQKWESGWACLFDALTPLTMADLSKGIYIRNMEHSVVEAVHRQVSHYAYHVGQIVFLGKMIQLNQWQSLSIPKGESKAYNTDKFSKPKRKTHFTDDL